MRPWSRLESEVDTVSTPHSFEELVLPLRDELVNYAYRLTRKDQETAEDIVQDALVRAYRFWNEWEPDGMSPEEGARAWMFRIVQNTFLNERRRVKKRDEMMTGKATDIMLGLYGSVGSYYSGRGSRHPHTSTAAVALIKSTEEPVSDEVLKAVARLQPTWRAVFERFHFQGMTCQQIGDELGIPHDTVSTQLCRARKKLRPILARYARDRYGLNAGLSVRVDATVEPAKVKQTQTDRVESVVGEHNVLPLVVAQVPPDQLPAW